MKKPPRKWDESLQVPPCLKLYDAAIDFMVFNDGQMILAQA